MLWKFLNRDAISHLGAGERPRESLLEVTQRGVGNAEPGAGRKEGAQKTVFLTRTCDTGWRPVYIRERHLGSYSRRSVSSPTEGLPSHLSH